MSTEDKIQDSWSMPFDDGQMNEITFCRLYLDQFDRETSGHNEKIIIATMAKMLDQVCIRVQDSQSVHDCGLKIKELLESWQKANNSPEPEEL